MDNGLIMFLVACGLILAYFVYIKLKPAKKIVKAEPEMVDIPIDGTENQIFGISYIGESNPSKKSGDDAYNNSGVPVREYFTRGNIVVGEKLYDNLNTLSPTNGGNKWIKLLRETDNREFIIKIGTTGNINIIYKS